MALQTPPWAVQALSHGAELFRRMPQSLLGGTGVVGSGDLAVTQNGTANMSVNVAAGQVWIPGTLGGSAGMPANASAQTGYGLPAGLTTQGSYYALNDATVNLTIAAADPTNPRIDLVVAAVQDAYYSGSSNQSVLQVITGTAASSPSAPTPPPNCVVLAQISVPANATSIVTASITDLRTFVTSYPVALRNVPAADGRVSNNVTVSNNFNQLLPVGTGGVINFMRGGVTAGVDGFIVPVTGYYHVSASVYWSTSAPGLYEAQVYLNTPSTVPMVGYIDGTSSSYPYNSVQISRVLYLTSGEAVLLGGYQSTGSSQIANVGSWLSLYLVGT